MQYLTAFITGGVICAIAQFLLNMTTLTPAKILVSYVVIGAILSAVGIYPAIVEFGGCGATIPLTGFGHALAQGVIKAVDEDGILGILSGGTTAVAGGIAVVILFGYLNAIIFKPRTKK